MRALHHGSGVLAIVLAAWACGGAESAPSRRATAERADTPCASPAAPRLLAALRDSLRMENARVDFTEVRDIRALRAVGRPGFVVVARGAAPGEFHGDFRDELFGVFVVDDSLTRVVAKLGVFPTARWHDYGVTVDRLSTDSVVVRGVGESYGDQPTRRAFAWP